MKNNCAADQEPAAEYDVFDEIVISNPAPKICQSNSTGKNRHTICEDIWNDEDFWPDRRYQTQIRPPNL